MTDAPERIVCRSGIYYEYSQDWYEGEWVTKEDNETYDFEQEVEYVRADLSTYDAGFAAGIEAAVTVQEAARVLRDAPELMEGWSEDGWADICALAEQE
jgi:hypothetical protein